MTFSGLSMTKSTMKPETGGTNSLIQKPQFVMSTPQFTVSGETIKAIQAFIDKVKSETQNFSEEKCDELLNELNTKTSNIVTRIQMGAPLNISDANLDTGLIMKMWYYAQALGILKKSL